MLLMLPRKQPTRLGKPSRRQAKNYRTRHDWLDRLNNNWKNKEADMLWTITIILFVLWALGLVTSYTLGGWIHLLIVLAVIVMLIRIINGKRPV